MTSNTSKGMYSGDPLTRGGRDTKRLWRLLTPWRDVGKALSVAVAMVQE